MIKDFDDFFEFYWNFIDFVLKEDKLNIGEERVFNFFFYVSIKDDGEFVVPRL